MERVGRACPASSDGKNMLQTLLARMIGAASLRVATYEDVENDTGATLQALLVVVLVSAAGGVGALLAGDATATEALVYGVLRSIVTWAVWALVAWIVGGYILRTAQTHADWGQLARGTGFAQVPGLLNLLLFVPGIGGLFALIAFFWQLAGMVVAVRQCLDFDSTARAFFVIVIGAIPVLVINVIIFVAIGI